MLIRQGRFCGGLHCNDGSGDETLCPGGDRFHDCGQKKPGGEAPAVQCSPGV